MTDVKHRFTIEQDRVLGEESFRIGDDLQDALSFFRGVLFAVSLSVPFWVAVVFWLA